MLLEMLFASAIAGADLRNGGRTGRALEVRYRLQGRELKRLDGAGGPP